MQLSVRDAAKILNVPEKTIHRWVESGELPAYKIHDQYHFNRAELLEWAATRKINTTKRLAGAADMLESKAEEGIRLPGLDEALESGGIYHDVPGSNTETVLRSIVGALRLPEEVDREFLYEMLLAREALGSTGIGEGIAIPHVRKPIVLQVAQPAIALSFLSQSVDFGAADGVRVQTLFTLISPTVRAHLHLLSRLTLALQAPGFKATILRRATREEILAEARRIEGGK